MMRIVPAAGDGEEGNGVAEAAALEKWLEEGWRRGWCSPPVCHSCDGVPMSEIEYDDIETYGETCVHVIRLYESEFQRKQVLREGGPVLWRASNRGWPSAGK